MLTWEDPDAALLGEESKMQTYVRPASLQARRVESILWPEKVVYNSPPKLVRNYKLYLPGGEGVI